MDEPSKPPSIWKQVIILFVSGLILSAGSCAGFLGSFNVGGLRASVFAIGFVVGVGLTIAGGIWALIRLIQGD